MKTIKQIIILLLACSILAGSSSCRMKDLHRQSTRISEKRVEDTRLRTQQHASYTSDRMTIATDSFNSYYRVRLFPVDTFSLSAEGNFKGMASSVEIIGFGRQVKTVSDSSAVETNRSGDIEYHRLSSAESEAAERIKNLNKKTPALISIFILILAAGIFWMLKLNNCRR